MLIRKDDDRVNDCLGLDIDLFMHVSRHLSDHKHHVLTLLQLDSSLDLGGFS